MTDIQTNAIMQLVMSNILLMGGTIMGNEIKNQQAVKHGFALTHNHPYNPAGQCWKLHSTLGEGYYWVYKQPEQYTIHIYEFSLTQDYLLEYDSSNRISIAYYQSVAGKEFSPYQRLNAGCIKTRIGLTDPYKAILNKNIPIRCICIEIMEAYYQNFICNESSSSLPSFQDLQLEQRSIDHMDMIPILKKIKGYTKATNDVAKFYDQQIEKLIKQLQTDYQNRTPMTTCKLTQEDILQLQSVTSYINDHYALDLPLEHLSKIANMGTTKLKYAFKLYHGFTITEYIQQRRMSHAEYLLTHTTFSMKQIANTIGYSSSSRFAELFKKSTGILPAEYRKLSTNKG